MDPIRTVQFAVSFAATWSAWWLVLVLPVVVLLAATFYRRQSRAIAQGHAWGLTLLRVIIMASVVVLAFRPSLIRRVTSTYPARLLMVLDDSGSMGIHDPAMPESDAVRIARKAQGSLTAREAPVADLREDVVTIERTLVRFEQVGRRADRTLDSFWREADSVQVQVNEGLDRVAERATALAGGANLAGGTNRLQEAAGRCRDLKASLTPLFTGNQPPAGEFVLKMRTALSGVVDLLGEEQSAADRAAMAAGDPALKAAVEAVRSAPRLELAYAWLQRHREGLIDNTKGLSLWLEPLSQKEPIPFSKIGAKAPVISAIETDITGVLLNRIEEDNPFPLAGILLISDGRNLGDTSLEAVTQAAALRSVPIFSAGIGGADEPPDLAVREVYCAPFAVIGKPLGVRTQLKTVLPQPEKVEMELINAKKNVITNETLEIGESQTLQRRPIFTPDEEGLQRLTVKVGTAKGEVVPQENNRQDLAMRVRPERVRVLFLDWKPRWESRFVLNILHRLDYLDVNDIIGIVQPNGQLKRGVGKGFWPEDSGGLALYDLVILGDLPPAGQEGAKWLTDAEWKQLTDYVKDGGSLVLLGSGHTDPLLGAAAKALLPPLPRTKVTPPPADTAVLQLTRAGRHHPVTRSLQGVLPTVESVTTDRVRNDTLALLQTGDGRLLISTHFVGKGKTLFIDTDRLWRRLNATALEAHSTLVMNLVDWAAEARGPGAGRPQPDLSRYTTRESVQVWVPSDGTTNQQVELRCGERRLAAPAIPAHPGATLASAVFEGLSAGDWTVTLHGGGSAPEPICVVDRSRELHDLSRNEAWLRSLADATGGSFCEFTDAGRLINSIQPRSRAEHRERIWRLWDSSVVLALLILLLTVEWVWRKLAGLA